jgi:putative hydrolase
MAAHHAAGKSAKSRLYDENTEMNVRAVLENDLKIMTHPGDKGALDMAEVAKACARKGTWMEISTWHKHLTVEEIRICMREDVRFVISSDAHTPDRVGSYIGGLEKAAEAGLDFDRIVNIRER